MSNLILSDSAAKAASASDFECVFGTEVVPVNQADFSTSEFTCKAPTFYDQAFYSTYINYKEHRVNSNVQRLQVLDCYSIPACGLCMFVVFYLILHVCSRIIIFILAFLPPHFN
jgi:hypothetical protein